MWLVGFGGEEAGFVAVEAAEGPGGVEEVGEVFEFERAERLGFAEELGLELVEFGLFGGGDVGGAGGETVL
jgi:hypothetical protein